MSNTVLEVSDNNFENDVLTATKPVLVDFWAEWCGPCKAISPVLDELAQEYSEQIQISKLNVDQNTDTPRTYGIRGIPSLLIFKEGKVVATKVGALSKTQLKEFINANL